LFGLKEIVYILNCKPKTVAVIGMQIISLAKYWCGLKDKANLLHL
jgi:hypothetical protein